MLSANRNRVIFSFVLFTMIYQCYYDSLSYCRVVDDEILLTMDDGRSALKVLELDGEEVIILLRRCEAIRVINVTS